LFPYGAFIFERDKRFSHRRSPSLGFPNLSTGVLRSSDLWVCSAPLALRGLWSSESYVTVSRFLFPAPWRPSLSLSLFGFLPWSAWAPLPLGRFRSFRSATSLRHDPWLIVSFELVSVMRFSSASELSPACTALRPSLGFTLATSRHSLLTFKSPFEVSGFLCPARPCGLPFPPSQFRLPWGFSALWKLLSLGVTRVALPLWGFFLLRFLQIQVDFGHGLLVHLKA